MLTPGRKVKRLSIRDQSSRWGLVHLRRLVVVLVAAILAPPYVPTISPPMRLAHLVEMNHSARCWRVGRKGLRHVERAKTWLDTHATICIATAFRLR